MKAHNNAYLSLASKSWLRQVCWTLCTTEKMRTNTAVFIALMTIASCISNLPQKEGWKEIDTGAFSIQVPNEWKYKPEKGLDSFVGIFKTGNDDTLSFDLSGMGYANRLIRSPMEYAIRELKWIHLVAQPNINSGEEIKTPMQKAVGERNGNIYAVLTYEDTVIWHQLSLPKELSLHNISIDTIGQYSRRIITPKPSGLGITGVYIEDLESSFNFQMNGKNLTVAEQDNAIMAYKSIKFNR